MQGQVLFLTFRFHWSILLIQPLWVKEHCQCFVSNILGSYRTMQVSYHVFNKALCSGQLQSHLPRISVIERIVVHLPIAERSFFRRDIVGSFYSKNYFTIYLDTVRLPPLKIIQSFDLFSRAFYILHLRLTITHFLSLSKCFKGNFHWTISNFGHNLALIWSHLIH